ncbi:hypothetical protein [Nitrosopumilus spindle-shaped virus]|uniref:Uncharacterized protein n=1 Tax=Nitrosopumilus spindle-shaped virus TaxID=2508184 RepID=A0A514K4I4_9VIRU|nr:hypothetical protein [Nitrosopumilus spindle-shaped virus]
MDSKDLTFLSNRFNEIDRRFNNVDSRLNDTCNKIDQHITEKKSVKYGAITAVLSSPVLSVITTYFLIS